MVFYSTFLKKVSFIVLDNKLIFALRSHKLKKESLIAFVVLGKENDFEKSYDTLASPLFTRWRIV